MGADRDPVREDHYLLGYHDRLARRYLPGRATEGHRDAYRRGWDASHVAVIHLFRIFEELRSCNCNSTTPRG
jgi:hypothetical protein